MTLFINIDCFGQYHRLSALDSIDFWCILPQQPEAFSRRVVFVISDGSSIRFTSTTLQTCNCPQRDCCHSATNTLLAAAYHPANTAFDLLDTKSQNAGLISKSYSLWSYHRWFNTLFTPDNTITRCLVLNPSICAVAFFSRADVTHFPSCIAISS